VALAGAAPSTSMTLTLLAVAAVAQQGIQEPVALAENI
jgi:hypothetical protein